MTSFENYARKIIEKLGPPPVQERSMYRSDSSDLGRILLELGGEAIALDELRSDDGDLRLPKIFSSDPKSLENDAAAGDVGVSDYGTDILAFYKSIHFLGVPPFRGTWGIFIMDFGIRAVSNSLQAFYPGRFNQDQADALACQFLHRHERYHFRFDAWVLSHEATLMKQLYVDYHNTTYQATHPGVDCVEETMANRHAYDSMKRHDIGAFLKDYCSGMPAAYSNIFNLDRDSALARLASQALDGANGWRSCFGGSRLEQVPYIGRGNSGFLADSNCPTYLVRRTAISKVASAFRAIPQYREWQLFVERYLNGQLVQRSDHEKRRIDNGEILKMPNPHGNDRLLPWEFKNSLQKAGMKPKDFRDERERTSVWTRHVPRRPSKPPLV